MTERGPGRGGDGRIPPADVDGVPVADERRPLVERIGLCGPGPADFHRGPHYFWGKDVGLIPVFDHYKGGTSGKDPLKRAALPRILP